MPTVCHWKTSKLGRVPRLSHVSPWCPAEPPTLPQQQVSVEDGCGCRSAHCRTEHTPWPRRKVWGDCALGGGGVTPGLSCPQLLYVCLISQFISRAWLSGEPSAPAIHQGLSPSHHSWEMRPKHSNSISPISPGYTARQLSQPGSTLFRTQRDNKTISANQKQLLSPYTPAGCCHSLRLPLGYAAVLKSHWLTLRFFFVLSHFLPQMKHFFFSHQLLFCGWIAEILICNHGVAQTLTTAVSCTLTLRLLWYDGIQDMMNKISVIMITHE